jgi:hypothetical protein
MIRGRQVSRYYHEEPKEFIWYKPELMLQKNGAGPRKLSFFEKEKIFIQDISQSIVACLSDKFLLSNDTLSVIYSVSGGYEMKLILAILNSKLINKWFKTNFQAGLHIKINQLQQIPLPVQHIKYQPFIINYVDRIIEQTISLKSISIKFSQILKSEFDSANDLNFLNNFFNYTWSDFNKELQKNKITLLGVQKDDWFDRFERLKKQALELKSQIDLIDKEIDRMVYELYGLTEEEIQIVENS